MKNMINEFKDFILKGNMLDMAVGIIIGAAFGTVVKSLVNNIIMPPIGKILGGIDFSNLFLTLGEGEFTSLKEAQDAGAATINYGLFINDTISLLIVGFAVFMMVKGFNTMRKKEEEAPSEPPKPSDEVVVLTEIRDLLSKS